MGFLFYITDFWFWRWKTVFETVRLRFFSHTMLKFYYINFFFVIFANTMLWRRIGRFILNRL